MLIRLNGKEREVAEGLTALELLAHLNLPPETVVVERNLKIVRRDELAAERLCDGDRLEIIRVFAGG